MILLINPTGPRSIIYMVQIQDILTASNFNDGKKITENRTKMACSRYELEYTFI